MRLSIKNIKRGKNKTRKLKNIDPYYLDTFFSKHPVKVSIRNIRVYKHKPREYSYEIWLNSDRVGYGLLHRAKNKTRFEKEVKKYIKEEYGAKKRKSR